MTPRKPKPKKRLAVKVHPICQGETRRIVWLHFPDTVAGFGTARQPAEGDHVWSRMRSGRTAVYEIRAVLRGRDGSNYIAKVRHLGYRGEYEDDVHAL